MVLVFFQLHEVLHILHTLCSLGCIFLSSFELCLCTDVKLMNTIINMFPFLSQNIWIIEVILNNKHLEDN